MKPYLDLLRLGLCQAITIGGKRFTREDADRIMQAGRNDPCPCGSGKKFKKCCGKGQ